MSCCDDVILWNYGTPTEVARRGENCDEVFCEGGLVWTGTTDRGNR